MFVCVAFPPLVWLEMECTLQGGHCFKRVNRPTTVRFILHLNSYLYILFLLLYFFILIMLASSIPSLSGRLEHLYGISCPSLFVQPLFMLLRLQHVAELNFQPMFISF